FRNLRSSQCTLTPKVFLPVSILSTVTTLVVREPSQQVRDLPQVIPLRHPPRWSNGSPPVSPPLGVFLSRWKTNWPLPSPFRGPCGAARRRSPSPPDRAFR